MLIDTTSQVIRARLDGSITTSEPVFNATYADLTATTFVAAESNGVMNGATNVSLVTSPAASTARHIKEIQIYNGDTADHTITVEFYDGSNARAYGDYPVPAGSFLRYGQEDGWRVGVTQGAGTVTSIVTGTGLTGGPITSSGTISFDPVADGSILANISGGIAPPIPNNLSDILDYELTSTQGSLIYRGGAGWTTLGPGTAGFLLQTGGPAANPSWITAPATGVTSVAMTVPSRQTVTGSPITSSGTLAVTDNAQSAATVFAGPTTGSAAVPTFRALISTDIPALPYVTSASLTMPAEFSVGGSPITSSGTFAVTWANEAANKLFAGPTTGSPATPTFRSLVAADIPVLAYVTSVGLALPAEFSVSGSPVTSSGTLTAAWANETANFVFAGPTTGSPAAPGFRALVAADIPSLSATYVRLDGSNTPMTGRFLSIGITDTGTELFGDQTPVAATVPVSQTGIGYNPATLPSGSSATMCCATAGSATAASTVTNIFGRITINGSTGMTTLQAMKFDAIYNSSGAITTISGVVGTARNTGGNTAAVCQSFLGRSVVTNAGSVATNSYDFFSQSPAVTVSGAITTQYGFYCQGSTVAGVTTGIAFYSNSASDTSRLAGFLAVGKTTVPATALDVNGVMTGTVNDAATNTTLDMLSLVHTTSGTAAANFGLAWTATLENAAGTAKLAARLSVVWSDATNASEDADWVVNLMAGGAAAAEKFRVTSVGNVYGTALHNNAVSPTGTTNQYIASGTYTPTLTNVANLDASTAFACQWMRVGNVVTVSGKVNVDPTLIATTTQLGITLPLASNLAADQQCAGAAAGKGVASLVAAILGDATNDRAQMEWKSIDTTSQDMFFSFTYVIL